MSAAAILISTEARAQDAYVMYNDQWVGDDPNGHDHPDGFGTFSMETQNPGYFQFGVNVSRPGGGVLGQAGTGGYYSLQIDFSMCFTGTEGEGDYPALIEYQIFGEDPKWGQIYLYPWSLSELVAYYRHVGDGIQSFAYDRCHTGACNTIGIRRSRFPNEESYPFLIANVLRLRVGPPVGPQLEVCYTAFFNYAPACGTP